MTIKEKLMQLPEGIRELAIKNTREVVLQSEAIAENPFDQLVYSFTWDETPEGSDYWNHLHKFKRLINEHGINELGIESQLVSFGNYLLSDKRRERLANHPEADNMAPLEDRLKHVTDADIANWREEVSNESRR